MNLQVARKTRGTLTFNPDTFASKVNLLSTFTYGARAMSLSVAAVSVSWVLCMPLEHTMGVKTSSFQTVLSQTALVRMRTRLINLDLACEFDLQRRSGKLR
jgi:hypothetical protein